MDEDETRMLEGLAEEFAQLPITVIVRIVTDRSQQMPGADSSAIEHAARADLHRAIEDG